MRIDSSALGRAAWGILLAGLALGAGAAVLFQGQLTRSERGSGGGGNPQRALPVRVEACGADRAWHFSYSGADGIPGNGDDPVSLGDLRLPAHTEVVINLQSRDFIYVFSCPELNLKEIAVPDLQFSLAFRTGESGRYSLAMDSMCGFPAAPGETMGTLRVVSEGDFKSWLDSCFLRSR